MLKLIGCPRCKTGKHRVKGVIHMVLWKFKSCPRCDGDIFVDRDLYGWYEQCLQCSYRRELIGIVELGQQQAHGVTRGTGGVKTLSKGK